MRDAIGRWFARGCAGQAAMLAALCAVTQARPPACTREWLNTFAAGEPTANCSAVFDDGAGPALYVAGGFDSIGALRTNRIAKWDGKSWSALGEGLVNGREVCRADAICVFDPDGDGPGAPMLFVGGRFRAAGGAPAMNLAAWDGQSWHAVPGGVSGDVDALGVFDEDGAGPLRPCLFVGGLGVGAAGVTIPTNIIKWDGESWSGVGAGAGFAGSQRVECFAVFDPDAAGPDPPELIVGGAFNAIPGNPASFVARWNGERWAECGGYPAGSIRRLTLFDRDGAGPAPSVLIVIGRMDRIWLPDGSNIPAGHTAQWDGSTWSSVGGGVVTNGPSSNGLSAAAVFDPDGDGPDGALLVVGGDFISAGGVPASNIAAWDGFSWSPLGAGLTGMYQYVGCNMLASFDDGSGERLFASGSFQRVGSLNVDNFAAWDGASWSRVGPAAGSIGGFVRALAMHDDGAGSALYAGGEFPTASGAPASNIAKWSGDRWAPLGDGVGGPSDEFHAPVHALLSFDEDGAGPSPTSLIAAGQFMSAGDAPAIHVARWSGGVWTPLPGLTTGHYQAGAYSLASFDEDGDGPQPPRLFAGGNLAIAGVGGASIARWTGVGWERVGTGPFNSADALLSIGSGPLLGLYAVGRSNSSGPNATRAIARWNGVAWSTVANGVSGNAACIAVFDDGAGPTLYVGGSNLRAGGGGSEGDLARLATSEWQIVQFPNGASSYDINALAAFDDGAGPALYIGGRFDWGPTLKCFARWNGHAWSSVGLGGTGWYTRERVHAMLPASFDGRPALFVGGEFSNMGGSSSGAVAAYAGCASVCAGDASGDGRVDATDLWLLLADFTRLLAFPGAEPTDLNLDGAVDFLDLNIVLSEFGQAC